MSNGNRKKYTKNIKIITKKKFNNEIANYS